MAFSLTDTALTQLLAFLAKEEDYVFLETTRITREEKLSYLFLHPVEHLCCHPGDDPALFFRQAEDFLQKGYYLAGWLAYEFGYLLEPTLAALRPADPKSPLARLGVFTEPHIFNHRTGRFSGAGPWPTKPVSAEKSSACAVNNLRPNLEQTAYLSAISRIKKYIESGDTYQVNYTFKLLFDLAGSPHALYRTLRRNQSVSFAAYIRSGSQHIMSFSPELFFRREGNRCSVRPMKGTIRRGPYEREDRRLARALKNDTKNRSENVMIVDLLRNDLGRVCNRGTVAATSLFDIETYETLHQMTSSIEGALPVETKLESLLRALFPCGSVTGAPKIRTMEIIRELEQEPRGIYTGAIGFIAPSGKATFNVPIRTLRLDGTKGEMGIGSGVVYDSNPEQEWQECLLKGQFLSNPAQPFKLIETLLWQPESGYWLLTEHMQRLQASARYFLYPCDKRQISKRLAELSASFGKTAMRVRLTLAKDGEIELNATASQTPPPAVVPVSQPGQDAKPTVVFSDQKTDPASTYLYHKTTLRELYDSERQRALAAGHLEVLFTNNRGEVTEGSISNIFIKKKGRLLTPPVESGLLNGVLRRHLLADPSIPTREKTLTRNDLEKADAVYIGNSVRGLVEVRLV